MMVLLTNFIPFFLLMVASLWGYYRVKKGKSVIPVIIGLIISFGVYQVVQPSYLPKGGVDRAYLPEFEEKDLEIQDRLLKPIPAEDRDAKRKQDFEEGLLFRKDNN